MTNNKQDHQGHAAAPSWNAAPITPPRQLGDGKFPPKVFALKRRERSEAWIAEHNPYPVGTEAYHLWCASFYWDQVAGGKSWKRSSGFRLLVIGLGLAMLGSVLSVIASLMGGQL